MRVGFTKGLIVGGIIGASMGMLIDDKDIMKRRNKAFKSGRRFMKTSSNLVSGIVKMMR